MDFKLVYWYWFIFAAFFFALEIFAPGAIFMWFGFGAIVSGIGLLLFPELSEAWQLMLFAVFSGASVLIWRKSKYFKEESVMSDRPELNNRLQSHVGKIYTLHDDIENGRASVRVGDSMWRVQCDHDLKAGTKVKVVGVDGITFLVERAEEVL